ncbi:hypothetical protein SAMN05444064_108185 [Pseudomonas syringae]|nr:hypothetical protein SAMN05444514_108185 [Pseudomonas syringae]SFM07572.1 hypothetical protein SAMN05444064_108185 [Pseudomonas syringae]
MGTNALEIEVSQLKDYYEELNVQLPVATDDTGARC